MPQIEKPKAENQVKSDAEDALSRISNNVISSVISDTNALELYHNTEDENVIEEYKQKVQNDSNKTNP